MYLTHVMLSRSIPEVGRLFGRDRTTVSHACCMMEDQRDDPHFEAAVGELEDAIRSWQDAGETTEVQRVAS